MDLANVIVIILCVLLVLSFMGHIVIINKYPQPVPVPVPVPVPSPSPLIGGCAGTRYGCCPNGSTPKMNMIGSNCR